MPANDFLKSFNFHKAFLGAWGVTEEDGFSDSHLLEVELKRLIVERAQEVIVVVDGSKFGRKALASYASLEQVSRIITDDSVPEKLLSDFHKNGADILVAS
jgi:DeoR/GlpR family transcriptional regulator of sugar metabolism